MRISRRPLPCMAWTPLRMMFRKTWINWPGGRLDRRQGLRKVGDDFYPLVAEVILAEGQRLLQDSRERDGLEHIRRRAGKPQHPARGLIQPVHLAFKDAERLLALLVAKRVGADQFQMRAQRLQRVVDLVGQRRGHPADGRQPLRPLGFIHHLLIVGDHFADHQQLRPGAGPAAHRKGVDAKHLRPPRQGET